MRDLRRLFNIRLLTLGGDGVTALLFPDEAARLVPGERLVIVRAGDPVGCADHAIAVEHCPFCFRKYVAPQDWVALTGPCEQCEELGLLSSDGVKLRYRVKGHATMTCGFCKGRGRRIVPLYTECEACGGDKNSTSTCGVLDCFGGERLVGRGSIEVVPVVDGDNVTDFEHGWVTVYDDGEVELWVPVEGIPEVSHMTVELTLDPLPVPGRDWGILIDCVEVSAS